MNIILTENTYRAISSQWVKTILHLSESIISMWAPLSGSANFARKFSKDIALQQELFSDVPINFLLIDFHQLSDISYTSFEEQCKTLLDVRDEQFSFDKYLGSHEKELFGICLMGMDTALNNMKTETLKEIGTLLEKHTHLSLVLLTETNFSDAPFFQDLITKVDLVGNLAYQPLFSFEDSVAFLSGLEEQWSVSLPKGYKQILAENIGGHLFLLEEAVRIYRDNPSFGFKEILSAHTLVTKATAIFNELFEKDQASIREILLDKRIPTNASEYLKKTGLVKDGKIGLYFWQYMKQNLSDRETPFVHNTTYQKLQLTYVEEKLLERLEAKNDIVSREEIASVLWDRQESAQKYSDWAIDQAIHRLREKVLSSQLGYEIKTVKGRGFVLSVTE